MNKEFIPYQEALALKQLGFDERTLGFYKNIGSSILTKYTHIDNDTGKFEVDNWNKIEVDFPIDDIINTKYVSAPLYQQAFRWFREKHNIKGYVMFSHLNVNDEVDYSYWIFLPNQSQDWRDVWNGTYEEAELACLKELIEIIKESK